MTSANGLLQAITEAWKAGDEDSRAEMRERWPDLAHSVHGAAGITPRDSVKSEGADGPVGRVALGLRFELYDVQGDLLGSFYREDVKGTAVPHSGDHLGRGTVSPLVHDLVGIDAVVHHVDHYLDVPQSKDWDPLAMVVVEVLDGDGDALRAAETALVAEGWSVTLPRLAER